MLAKFVKYLQKIRTEALSNMGICPDCKSYDLTYEDIPLITSDRVVYKFVCDKCGKKGREVFSLKYMLSIIAKEGLDADGEGVQLVEQNSRRTRKANQVTN
jgi:hypothetical protein